MTPEQARQEVLPHRLRWIADNYEQCQKLRIAVGERIRAVLQGRDNTKDQEGTQPKGKRKEKDEETDRILAQIRKGEIPGPVDVLSRSYCRYWEEEQEAFKDMQVALVLHPANYWLSGVRGIGPTLACKILARLDVGTADHISSFWKHGGLATVPGKLYRCTTCGLESTYPAHYKIKGPHQELNGTKPCKGSLEYIHSNVRVAEPPTLPKEEDPEAEALISKEEKDEKKKKKRAYDAYLKKTLWLAGSSFLKAGGPYEEFYRVERAKAAVDRPSWRAGKQHFLALRKTQKLFLSHLWKTWRQAVGLPITEPYAADELGHAGMLDPWDFTEAERPE
jgi:hypothetical protein